MRYVLRRRKRLQGAEAFGLLKSGDYERPCRRSVLAGGLSRNPRSLIGRRVSLIALCMRASDLCETLEGPGRVAGAKVVHRTVPFRLTTRVRWTGSVLRRAVW